MPSKNVKNLLLFVLFIATISGVFFIFQLVRRNVNLTALTSQAEIAEVELPPGFKMNVYAQGLDGPRFITFDPQGVLYVAERGAGRILRLPDLDRDGVADRKQVFRANLDRPHSIAIHQGIWYVGIPNGIVRLSDDDQDGIAESEQMIVADIPASGQHTTRTVEFLPDGRLLLSVGSSCNACIEEDTRRAAIVVYENSDGVGGKIYARGLRNAVGLTVHPVSGALWATNNARDLMGDDLPADSLHLVEEGLDYGWPECHAGSVPDPDLGGTDACQGVPEPALRIQAHSAPLGLVFYNGNTFPEKYRGGLFIAYHGSWNRTVPTGYKVVFAPFSDLRPTGETVDFAVGWLEPETSKVSGRPVGLAVGPDGALYISDDKAGVIYRVQYKP